MANEKMKQTRQELNLSQAELAKRVGVSRQTVNMIENGDYNPTIALCIRICRELGKTLDELFWVPAPEWDPPPGTYGRRGQRRSENCRPH